MNAFILVLSIGVQFATALYALTLIRSTGKSIGWVLLAAALTLMGIRRCITLYNQWSGFRHAHLQTELVALFISVLMFVGILFIASTIRKLRHVEEITRLNQQLERERGILNTLVERMPDAIYFKDRASRFVRVNPGACRIFGASDPESVVGKSDADFFRAGEAAEYLADEQRVMETDQPLIGKEEHECWQDGEMHWVLTTKMPWHDQHGNTVGTFGISRDITDLKAVEEALENANEELRRSNVDLEHFAYVASHDLQEPLRAVTGYCQLLERGVGDKLSAKEKSFLRGAIEGATRMHGMIEDLLEYSRVHRKGEAMGVTDMNAVFEQAKASISAAAESAHADITADPLPKITADEKQMVRLLQNLLGNALKYRGTKCPEIHVSAEDGADTWDFSVADNGIGIDPKFHEKIFLLFQRLHSRAQVEGTGLGLAICKRIVDRHGGRIWVESQPDEGATFHFTIQKSLGKTTHARMPVDA
ncbi:MAG: PAS domain-containing protein [Planctomycetales bacterium]|nr:PAS domain-containing protein [Planctomycetales bacterium]